MSRRRGVLGEEGVALIIALVVVLILAAIVLAMGQMTSGELEIHRLSRWDTLAQYLAQAGVEHQIYLLKENRDAGAVPYIEYPQLPQYAPGLGPFWYIASRTCTLNCTGTPSLREWSIQSYGEIWNYDSATATWTLLQQRTIRAGVRITYSGSSPTAVTLLRWEEAYP